MSEIKRCPICGEVAHLFTWIDRNQKKYYGIMCESWHGPKDWYDTEAEAISAWNNEDYSKCTTCNERKEKKICR